MTDEPTVIVVELKPYRERRRIRQLAGLILIALVWTAYVAPALVELADHLLGHVGPAE